MISTEFSPATALAGGALIGLSATILIIFTGRIAGVSGVVSQLFPPYRDSGLSGRVAFTAGLLAAPLLLKVSGFAIPQTVSSDLVLLVVAGFLVGLGTVVGNGCTSGNGVCGLARLSPRSLVATLVFMAAAATPVFVIRHLIVG